MTENELRLVARFGPEQRAIGALEELRQRKIARMAPKDFAPIPRRLVS